MNLGFNFLNLISVAGQLENWSCFMSQERSSNASYGARNLFLYLPFLICISGSVRADCTSHGERECSDYWNIYSSIPNGDRWEFDRIGSDPVAIRADRQAKQIVSQLRSCGIDSQLSNSSWFSGFTRNYLIVHSNSFRNANAAKGELQQAKQCGINGYTKPGTMNVPGPGED